jgi:hypothetical protein
MECEPVGGRAASQIRQLGACFKLFSPGICWSGLMVNRLTGCPALAEESVPITRRAARQDECGERCLGEVSERLRQTSRDGMAIVGRHRL